MVAKLVVVGGEHPAEHVLTGFNTLGSDPDSSIVLDDPSVAGEHARLILSADGVYMIRAVDGRGELGVNGQRVAGERVLSPGDEIAAGGARFRFTTTDPYPPVRLKWRLRPSMALDVQWTCHRARGSGRILSLHAGRLAVGRTIWSRGRSRLLIRDGAQWRVFDEVAGDIRTLWELGDGSRIAAGPGRCWHGPVGSMRGVATGSTGAFRCIWGPSAECAYGLVDGALWHFDGDRWRQVDLAAQGLGQGRGPGATRWTDGTCDQAGRCWLVGNDMKHGSLITGTRLEWEFAADAGITAMSGIACGADGTLFMLGHALWPLGRASQRWDPALGESSDDTVQVREDPRWSGYGGRWRAIAGFGRGRETPRLMTCCEHDGTWVIIVDKHRGTAPMDRLRVFLGQEWRCVELPGGLTSADAPTTVTRDGRLVLAQGSAIWESSALFDCLDKASMP